MLPNRFSISTCNAIGPYKALTRPLYKKVIKKFKNDKKHDALRETVTSY